MKWFTSLYMMNPLLMCRTFILISQVSGCSLIFFSYMILPRAHCVGLMRLLFDLVRTNYCLSRSNRSRLPHSAGYSLVASYYLSGILSLKLKLYFLKSQLVQLNPIASLSLEEWFTRCMEMAWIKKLQNRKFLKYNFCHYTSQLQC